MQPHTHTHRKAAMKAHKVAMKLAVQVVSHHSRTCAGSEKGVVQGWVGGWGYNQADSSRAHVLSGQQGGNTEGKEQKERKRKRGLGFLDKDIA